jgi:hypothetical protein
VDAPRTWNHVVFSAWIFCGELCWALLKMRIESD